MGSERPENCPVDSFPWRTGGSPGKGVTTIESAVSATIEDADIPYYVRRTLCLAEDTHVTEGQPYCHVLIKR